MGLRITQGTLYARTMFNIQRSLAGSVRLQQQIASGQRVNRPSDDPAATLRILPLTSDLRNLEQLRDNARLARETINTGSSNLEEASATMQRVRELTIQAANGTIGEQDRRSIGQEIDQLLRQMVGVANGQRAGRYLFGGTRSDQAPFVIEDLGDETRVRYRGNNESLSVGVAPGIETELNIPGDEIFVRRNRQATTLEGATGITTGVGLDTGVGEDRLQVTFAGLDTTGITGIAEGTGTTTALGNLAYTFTAPDQLTVDGETFTVSTGDQTLTFADGRTLAVDLTLPITPGSGSITSTANLSIDGGATQTLVDFSGGGTNVRLSDGADGSVLHVDVANLARTGDERVIYEGTFDVFTTLIELRDLMVDPPADLSTSDVAERLSSYLGRIDSAHDDVLDALRGLGFRSGNMTLLENRVENLSATSEESLSLAKDTEITEALVEYQKQQFNYQASLNVGARVVQVTLLNFL